MISLPFTQLLGKDRSFWRGAGMLTIRDEGMGVEWRSDEYHRPWGKANPRHVGRGELHDVLIPWTSIESVTFSGRLLAAGTLRICARSIKALDALPGANGHVWTV